MSSGIPEKDKASPRVVIGARIRQLREAQGMRIEDLAARLADNNTPQAVQKEVHRLERLENGNHLPSIKILLKTARILGKRLGHLMDEYASVEPVIMRKDDLKLAGCVMGSNVDGHDGELAWYALAENKADRHMEPWLIELKPRPDVDAQLEGHEAEEFVYVLSGRIVVQHGQNRYELEAGDSISYNCTIPHHLHAIGEEPARIIAVFYGYMKNEPTIGRGYPAQRVTRTSTMGYTLPDGNMAYYQAALRMPESVRPFVVEVGPEELPIVTYRHEGEELHHVLSGKVQAVFGEGRNEVKYELAAGDSIYFDSLVPHRMQRIGDAVARVLTVAYEPA